MRHALAPSTSFHHINSSCIMDSLPNELIQIIVANLPTKDTVSLRLTNRRLSKCCAHLLYPRIWLSSHPLDVEVFRRAIRNPLICEGVRELIWDDTTYCDCLTDRGKYMETLSLVTSYTQHASQLGGVLPSHEG